MSFDLPALRKDEVLALKLRALYEESGYRLFRTSSFEEYDLYMQNKPFLMGDDIISFTAADGRLMALRPDVTLSIVKNTPPGVGRKLYYNEQVYRRSRRSGEYREINQMGLEYIGAEGQASDAEVLRMALRTLAVVGDAVLDLSHMEYVTSIMALFKNEEYAAIARDALRDKSPHNMRRAAQSAGLSAELADVLVALTELSGPFEQACERAMELSADIPGTQVPLAELSALYRMIKPDIGGVEVRLDFSIINDVGYYNGLMFQGYAGGATGPVLAGGRYDNLMRRFEKSQGAVGFALYLNMIGEAPAAGGAQEEQAGEPWLNIALPKGRLGTKVYKLLEALGLACDALLEDSRRLVFEDDTSRVRYYLVKPTDVDIYVEHGVADIGVVGRDILMENGSDVLELLDLGFGKCRLSVAGIPGFEEDLARPLQVATKYPQVARAYYASKSRSVEIIELHGSVELAPLIGLSDVIVDIVETGSTLRENQMDVLEEIAPSSARLIANRAAWRFKEQRIRTLAERLGEMV